MTDVTPRDEPVWLPKALMLALHAASIARFGGSVGLRSEALLESALARPRQLYAYGEAPTFADLAAAYGVGLVKNHPFVDGNKRTGLLAIRAFLFRNGIGFQPGVDDSARVIEAVAAGTTREADLAAWIRTHAQPRT